MAHLTNIFKKYILLYYVPHSPLIISLNVFFDGFLWILLFFSTPESVHPKTLPSPPKTEPPGTESDRIESCIESSNNPPWLPGHNPSYLTNRSKIADVLRIHHETRVYSRWKVGVCKIGRGQGCVFRGFRENYC